MQNPKGLLLYAHPKVGKTTTLAGLQGCLILDLEDGSDYIDNAYVINVLALSAQKLGLTKARQVLNHPEGINAILQTLFEIHTELQKNEVSYDYIAIDTVTALVEIAAGLATIEYKKSIIGKNYTGTNVVKDLPKGAGYPMMWEAFDKILTWFDPYAKQCMIIVAHTKDSAIIKDGVDLTARDLNLTGKLRELTCSRVDCIGHLRRVDGNKTVLSFKTEERDVATGARPPHLSNQEIVIVEEVPAGSRQFVYHWDKVFIKP